MLVALAVDVAAPVVVVVVDVVVVVVVVHAAATSAAEWTVPLACPLAQSVGHTPSGFSYAKLGHGSPVQSLMTPGPAHAPHVGAML